MTSDLRPYPEYKDSGLPWLGRVPKHWRLATLRRVAHVQLSNVDKHTIEGEQPVRLCNYTDVYYHRYITPGMDLMKATAVPREIEKFELRRGDVLITKDSEDWKDIAVPSLVTTDMPGVLCGYHLAQIRPDEGELHGDYLMWACRSESVALQFRIAANGVTRYGVSGPDIKGALLPLPPVQEQQVIGRYLRNVECKVNRFIRNRRRLIEVLNEQKQAVINRAVTRGLDPNARLKPSGIDWLGDIPEHWKASRLKRYLVRNDGGVWGSGFSDEGTIVLRSTEQTVDGQWRITDPARRTVTDQERLSALLAEGDLLVTKSSGSPAHIGKTTLVSADVAADGCCFSNFMQRLRLNRLVTPRFGWRVLNSILARRQLQYLSNSTTGLGNLSSNILGNIWMAVPPTTDQDYLLDLLDAELQPFEHSIATAKREIDLIREYRTRLIADVVTGKVDVRHLAPPPGSEGLEEMVEVLEPLDDAADELDEEALAGEVAHADD